MYIKEKNSVRKTAKELCISKSTVDYYLKKFEIKIRTKSEATKERFKWDKVWCEGLSKETDERLKKSFKKVSLTWRRKKEKKINEIESKFKMKFPEILNYLYWDKKLTQEKIAKELDICRDYIIKFMRKYKIKLRPNYEYIRLLKGEKHPMYGKTWEEIYGIEGAEKIRKMHSIRSRNLIIKRIKNNEFPFFNTKIELAFAKEMSKRNISFVSQFSIDNKFVCDFAMPAVKLIIECDGDYWHANPKIYDKNKLHKRQINNLKRDKFKDKYLNKKGWKVIRFFGSDIKENISNCVDKVEKFLKNN